MTCRQQMFVTRRTMHWVKRAVHCGTINPFALISLCPYQKQPGSFSERNRRTPRVEFAGEVARCFSRVGEEKLAGMQTSGLHKHATVFCRLVLLKLCGILSDRVVIHARDVAYMNHVTNRQFIRQIGNTELLACGTITAIPVGNFDQR